MLFVSWRKNFPIFIAFHCPQFVSPSVWASAQVAGSNSIYERKEGTIWALQLLCSWTSSLTSTDEGECKRYSQQGSMKYHFYSSVSLSIFVETTSEGLAPNAARGMMKLLSGQGSSVLFFPQSEEVALAFFVACLWSASLFFPYDSSLWPRQRLLFQQTQPLPFRAKRQAVEERRQQDGSREDRDEESMQFHPPLEVSGNPTTLSTLPLQDLIQRLT